MAIRGDEILRSLNLPDFEPFPFFKGGFGQTISGAIWPAPVRLPKEKFHWIEVDQDEHVLLTEYPNKKAKRAALLVHGLNGSYESVYNSRIARRLLDENFVVYCLNMRNCGPGLGKAKSTYHAGRSEDVVTCLEFISKGKDIDRIALVGFSLGANIVLKALGEGQIDQLPIIGVAVSPPVDLQASTHNRLHSAKGKIFDLLFSYLTYQEFKAMRPYLKSKIQPKRWHIGMSLKDIDNIFTAPLNNFDSAQQYYEMSSAARVYKKIKKPTLVLTAYDDPVICPEFLLNAEKKKNISLVVTEKGGHVAFVHKCPEVRQWMDELVIRYIKKELDSGRNRNH